MHAWLTVDERHRVVRVAVQNTVAVRRDYFIRPVQGSPRAYQDVLQDLPEGQRMRATPSSRVLASRRLNNDHVPGGNPRRGIEFSEVP